MRAFYALAQHDALCDLQGQLRDGEAVFAFRLIQTTMLTPGCHAGCAFIVTRALIETTCVSCVKTRMPRGCAFISKWSLAAIQVWNREQLLAEKGVGRKNSNDQLEAGMLRLCIHFQAGADSNGLLGTWMPRNCALIAKRALIETTSLKLRCHAVVPVYSSGR